ncbi:MAG: sugar ABC transporter permease [Chloroflexota bacterium]|nr:sugar ABC transporter permease [Chloroflexota bacterium]
MATAVSVREHRDVLARLGIKTLAGRQAALGYSIVGLVYLFFVVFVFGPIILAFVLSLLVWDGLKDLNLARQFVGLDNYLRLFADERFRFSVVHDFEFATKAYVGQIGAGLLLALAANNIRRFRRMVRSVTFLPVILPIPATAILFVILMNPVWGVLNVALGWLGLPPQGWVYVPESAMASIVLMVVWKFAGYYMVLFLAALATVPQELYDAAHIDGANGLQSFRRITWPLIRPAFLFISIINVVANLQVFTPVWMMTAGGPVRSTEVIVVLMYNTAFGYFQYSLANAMAIVLFVIILLLTIVQLRIMRTGGMEAF